MMNVCIDRYTKYVILCIVRLCKEYEQYYDEQPSMKRMSNIPFDLLVKAVCASLPEEDFGEWEEVVQKVEQVLLGRYVSYEDKEKETIWITGGDGSFEKDELNYFYAWSFFQYTYMLDREDEEKRKIFLWRTVLLPYIHKVNKNSPETVKDEIKKILEAYPIVEGKTLDILKANYKEDKKWLEDMIAHTYKTESVREVELSKANIDNAFDVYKSGCICLFEAIKE